MKLIKPTFEILEQAPGMDGMLKHIELCGRTCYKSQDKITEGSAEKFVERMKSNQHLSVLEHGTVYLTIEDSRKYYGVVYKYLHNKYSSVYTMLNNAYVTTNYRVIIENGWESDLKYECAPTEYHEKRVTVRFTTDIGISREFNRHRVNSVSEQSTRYCNYSKDKFGNEISVVPPKRLRDKPLDVIPDVYGKSFGESFMYEVAEEIVVGNEDSLTALEVWMFSNIVSQWSYNKLTREFGWAAQDARSVLPLDTQTELVHTAYVSDWENFFKLRCDEHAHPMARELAIPLREEFVKRELIEE